MSVIGENIKRLRKEKGYDQLKLGELLSVSDKTISSWEVGRTEPKMGKIEELCKIFNCKKTDIIEPYNADIIHNGLDEDMIIEYNYKPDSEQVKRLSKYAQIIAESYDEAPENVKKAILNLLNIEEFDK